MGRKLAPAMETESEEQAVHAREQAPSEDVLEDRRQEREARRSEGGDVLGPEESAE